MVREGFRLCGAPTCENRSTLYILFEFPLQTKSECFEIMNINISLEVENLFSFHRDIVLKERLRQIAGQVSIPD